MRLAANDFKSKYAGSAIGTVWAIAEPLVTVAVYWFVYTAAVGGNSVGEVPYYLWLSIGIAPWFFVSNGLREVTSAYRDYSYLVKKMAFDTSVIPAVRMFSALISHLIFLGIVIILSIAEGIANINILSLILVTVSAMVYVLSVGEITAIICARHRNFFNIVGIALNIGFWITPVFWTIDGVGENIGKLIMLNPAAIITEGYRTSVLHGGFISGGQALYLILICVILIIIGRVYRRNKLPYISDNL